MPRVAPLLCLVSLALLASCNSFDARWATTPMPPTANPAALADGKWEGTWQSDATDFNGHIQAIILHTTQTILDKETVQQYEASFRMRYFEIGYGLVFPDTDELYCDYASDKDAGTYKMRRIVQENQ